MSEKKSKGHSKEEELDESDLKRAEKNSPEEAPLASSEEDAYVDETELKSSEPSKEEKAANDPTSERSATS